jgi:hypothetical protein
MRNSNLDAPRLFERLSEVAESATDGSLPTVIKNDRWYVSLFGAPPPTNPATGTRLRAESWAARDTNALRR